MALTPCPACGSEFRSATTDPHATGPESSGRPAPPVRSWAPLPSHLGLRRLVGAAFCAALAGCGPSEASEAGVAGGAVGPAAVPLLADSVFALDLSTPDRALKSYWRVGDLAGALPEVVDTTSAAARNSIRWRRAYQGLHTGVALAEVSDTARAPETYSREIVKVEQETDSRAVVLARIRNTTSIPAGATPTQWDIERRRDGELVRYIFEREAAGWKLSQIQTAFVDGEWRNRFDDTPLVPTYVTP